MDSATTSHQKLIKHVEQLALDHGVTHQSPNAGSLGTWLFLVSNTLDVVNPNAPITDDIPELGKMVEKLKSILQVRIISNLLAILVSVLLFLYYYCCCCCCNLSLDSDAGACISSVI